MSQFHKKNLSIIAEIGSVHDGSFGNAIKLIDLTKECGADIVKFQMHIPEEETLDSAPSPEYFKNEQRFEYFERIKFNKDQWTKLYKYSKKKKIKFMVSPFSEKALDILLETGIDYIKVASGEVTNFSLLEKIVHSNIPCVLSTGMSDWNEIDSAIKILKKGNLAAIMQCSSIYPCPINKIGINIISELKKKYKYEIGLSDHSEGELACLAALCFGATFFEKHITFSRKMYGSDATNAMEPKEFRNLTKNLRDLHLIISSNVNKNDLKSYKSVRHIFQKSIYYKADLKRGSRISKDNISFKKPYVKISSSEYKKFIGKILKKEVKKNQLLKINDF